METQLLHALWLEARTRFYYQIANLQVSDLTKRLPGSPNSVGFLLRHMAEVELLFSKNVFGLKDVHVVARTVIDQKDNGTWTNLDELLALERQSFSTLEQAILTTPATDWSTTITTKEFGTKTKAEALGRIVSHTAYHAGQMAMLRKYGE